MALGKKSGSKRSGATSSAASPRPQAVGVPRSVEHPRPCAWGSNIVILDDLLNTSDARLRRLGAFLRVRGAAKMERSVLTNLVLAKIKR